MNSIVMTNDYMPNLTEDNSKEFPNLRQNLCRYLLKIVLNDRKYNQKGNGENITRISNLEYYLRNAVQKGHTNEKNETGLCINIDELVPFFVEECFQNFLNVDFGFAHYYLHLLVRDFRDGFELNMPSKDISIDKIEQFLLSALAKYKNPMDATVCCMKIAFYCKTSKELNLNFVKEKYELEFNEKLKQLKDSILQYPETSSNKQLDEMFLKMQVFIITNYQMGYPQNQVLLQQCRQSLNSILGKGDIQKYVLGKRYHRLEYLKKLGATTAGILIFNQGPERNKENVRNIFADLKMAITNTKESLQEGFDRVHYLKQEASKILLELIEINIQQENISCLRPFTEIRELNKFVVVFEVYRRNLEKVKTAFEKTQYLKKMDEEQFDVVLKKLNDILKYRSAIESELIFPHFVYLSEIWNSLVLYLNHLVELNKIKDHLDELFSEKMENKFNDLLKDLSDKSKHLRQPINCSLQEAMSSTVKRETNLNMLNIKPFVKDYCALTIALTGGLLVPSHLQKKLCENVDFYFGFANMKYAKFSEHNFKDIITAFRTTILTCCDLIVLFELDENVMQQDFDLIQKTQAEATAVATQTEINRNEIMTKNHIKTSWNIWEFHRETIKLANIRKRQTHSTQSNLSYGLRNAQNQCDGKSNRATQN